MKILVLDLETTVHKIDNKTDNSPYNPLNEAVSAHYGWLTDTTVENVQFDIWHHNECRVPDGRSNLDKHLACADLLVCQNAKFDASWLLEMGFELPPIYCTMIAEFLLAKARKLPLSLKAIAERRQVTAKKSDLVDGMFKSGIGFEEMPLDTVVEYANADVVSCGEIYLSQMNDFAKEENKSLLWVKDSMNEMLLVLLEMERNGVCIDKDALQTVKTAFVQERDELTTFLQRTIEKVMGDKPFNMNSAVDMTAAIYSRVVTDKPLHKQQYNLGTDKNGRAKFQRRLPDSKHNDYVRASTQVVHKTIAEVCPECKGRKFIQRMKVDGTPFKNTSKCPSCLGEGAIYQSTGKVAGFMLIPLDSTYASANGFKTDKHTIALLIDQAKQKGYDDAVEFLSKLSRLSAITTYIDTFITGIENWTRPRGFLHTNFNQCIASTGRLSSSNINMQNMPKRGFPVRKAFVSRFENGTLIEADYGALEWRIAAQLSQDKQAIKDILNGKDAHKQTACIINECEPEQVTKDARQGAKKHSFAPLFGSTGNGQPKHIKKYYDTFFKIYPELGQWHKSLMDGVLNTEIVQTPSGRQYMWENPKRTSNGISDATQVKNYPVQGFSADIVQLACIRAYQAFKKENLRSKIILSVHDSLVVDCCPTERIKVINILTWAMKMVTEEVEQRWDYPFVVPLDIEISEGKNWLEQVELD